MANEPGWYADPWQPGRRRWWDGTQWTDHIHDDAVPPGGPQGAPPWQQEWRPVTPWQPIDPAVLAQRQIGDERGMATWAKRALVVIAITGIVGGLVAAITFHDYIDDIRRSIDEGHSTISSRSSLQLWTQPISLLGLASQIMLMVWSHRAMVVARNLRYPARYSVGWSVAGWIVPIINFWFPYCTMRDLLPEGHPDRATVKRWWALYLLGTFGSFAVIGAAIASTSLAIAVELPVALCAVLAANLGVHLVGAVLDDHAAAVTRVTGVA